MWGGIKMGLICIVVIVALLVTLLDSLPGKIVLSATVLAIGLLLLRWITGVALFVTLAKVCAIIIVIAIVGTILLAIIG